jgi:cellulose synthase/poly-beta-1,6-N-acetylglucosamine synthase-like glycosyltransferase
MTWQTAIPLLLLPLALLWLLPFASDLLSLLARLFRVARPASPAPVSAPTRLAFLVPAHNEALLIDAAVRSLIAQRHDHVEFAVWVVADNCDDDTAALARRVGATVLERRDQERPGKPAAIAWALGQIPLDDRDAVVIIDADTMVDVGFAEALAERAPLRDKAVQAWFGSSNPEESWLTRLASLLVDVRYEGQFALKRDTGLNVVLTGNGMCLGTGLLGRCGWVSDSLTEDLEMYARFTALGERIDYAAGAQLYAQEARDLGETATQRRRWQAGRWQVLASHVAPLLRSRAIGARQRLDALAELSFSGPVAHASVALLFGAGLCLLGTTAGRIVGGIFLLSIVPMAGWTCWALFRRSDRLTLMVDLLRLPFYAVWRGGLAIAALLTGRSGRWERSPRH